MLYCPPQGEVEVEVEAPISTVPCFPAVSRLDTAPLSSFLVLGRGLWSAEWRRKGRATENRGEVAEKLGGESGQVRDDDGRRGLRARQNVTLAVVSSSSSCPVVNCVVI